MTPSQTAIEAAERIHPKLRRDEIAAIIQAAIDAEAGPLMDALETFWAFYQDLSKSNPGFMGPLVLRDYAQFNEAMIKVNRVLKAKTALTNTERKKRR